ncbi:MAG TPA: 5-formyltetrahydrofolate cyclo-ligase, partial [Caulobacteraceae bacterium]
REFRARRSALHAAHPEAAVLAATHWPAGLGPFTAAALYAPTGSEVDPRPLGLVLGREGCRLCLPVVTELGAPLAFRPWTAGEPLVPDALGMAAPGREAEAMTPDVVVTPLLAFDRSGGRMGQGGGYYDRTIEQLRAKGRVFVLGLAFAGQEVEKLPAEDHDQPLDAVLTEAGFRLFAKDR